MSPERLGSSLVGEGKEDVPGNKAIGWGRKVLLHRVDIWLI
jgi:hypothetical protein